MTPILRKLRQMLSRPWERLEQRFRSARPGSVLIMVVALLVLLALMGTAYLASARLERATVTNDTAQRQLNEVMRGYLDQLVNQAQSLITRDAGTWYTTPTLSADTKTATQT